MSLISESFDWVKGLKGGSSHKIALSDTTFSHQQANITIWWSRLRGFRACARFLGGENDAGGGFYVEINMEMFKLPYRLYSMYGEQNDGFHHINSTVIHICGLL